jgi:hypothetical protein
MGMIRDWQAAMPLYGEIAQSAFKELREWCDLWPGRVPGMDTVSRLALRIYYGKTVEQAIASEYLYRWNLAVKPFDQCEGGARNPAVSVFGVPHTLGM